MNYNSRLALLFWGLSGVIFFAATQGGAATAALSLANPSAPVAAGGNNDSLGSVISADGRLVLFLSSADNLVTNDDNGRFIDIFLRNRTNGTTTPAVPSTTRASL